MVLFVLVNLMIVSTHKLLHYHSNIVTGKLYQLVFSKFIVISLMYSNFNPFLDNIIGLRDLQCCRYRFVLSLQVLKYSKGPIMFVVFFKLLF